MIEVFVPPASSVIGQLEYDDQTDTVGVTFSSGSDPIQYLNVPKATYRAWTVDASAGGFYNRHIKGKYPSEPV